MATIKTQLDVVDGMRGTTLYVKIKRGTELQWRIWLATRLIMLAAMIMNCNIEIEA